MRHHHSPGIRGQLMWFLCCICLFLLALVWFLSTQLLEPLYTKHIEKQLTTQAESITAELDKAIANGEALSAWSFGHLTVNTAFFDRLATQLYASGSLNSFCVDISDTTMRTIYKIENQSYCNLHETLLSDSANNDMIVSTAVAMRKKCRKDSSFYTLKRGMIKWDKVLEDAGIFHCSGITCAISRDAMETTMDAIELAVKKGLTISCDINYRKNLWGYGLQPRDVLYRMMQYSDIIFGDQNEWEVASGGIYLSRLWMLITRWTERLILLISAVCTSSSLSARKW